MYPSLQNKVGCKSASQTWSSSLIKSQQTCAVTRPVPPRVQTLGRSRLKGSGAPAAQSYALRIKQKRLGYFTLAWKWIPCWYASSLWSGTLESARSSTRLYLFLAGITEDKPTDDAFHSGLRDATVPIPDAPVPCVIPERLRQ